MNRKRWKPKRKYEVQLRDSRSYKRFLWSIGLAIISLAISFISGFINKPPEYDIGAFRTFMEQRQDSLSKLKTTDTSKTSEMPHRAKER